MRVLLLASALWAFACSAEGGGTDASADAADAAADGAGEVEACIAFKVVGQPCDDACECLGGQCVLNEFAPFRFCTRPCDDAQPGAPAPSGAPVLPGAPCAPEPGLDKFTSFCVEFPSDFLVGPRQFCAPLCSQQFDCAKLGAPWESCEKPHWKGNTLYSALPDQVCMAASAQGHMPVDPDTCEGWEPLFDEFAEERLGCIGFCDFLSACQLLKPGSPKACCAWNCMQGVVVDGVVQVKHFKDDVRCFFDNFLPFRGSALACTQPVDVCGEPEVP